MSSVDSGAEAPSVELAWLRFEVSKLELWHRYLAEVLAVHVDAGWELLKVRLDDRRWRMLFTQGPRDDLTEVAWNFPTEEAFEAAVARARAWGAEVEVAHPMEADVLRVHALARLRDPGGVPVALLHGQARGGPPLELPHGHRGFVAGDLGLGHVVLRTKDKARSMAFYEEVLGLRRSDRIVTEIAGHAVDLDFFHVPGTPAARARHHSLAVGGPLPKRLHHFMLECRSVDDVGACYDRMIALDLPIFQTLGRHPNDRMLSFYAVTPSGFQVEVGWGGRLVEDETWEPRVYEQISEWGHHHPTRLRPRRPRLEGWPSPPEKTP